MKSKILALLALLAPIACFGQITVSIPTSVSTINGGTLSGNTVNTGTISGGTVDASAIKQSGTSLGSLAFQSGLFSGTTSGLHSGTSSGVQSGTSSGLNTGDNLPGNAISITSGTVSVVTGTTSATASAGNDARINSSLQSQTALIFPTFTASEQALRIFVGDTTRFQSISSRALYSGGTATSIFRDGSPMYANGYYWMVYTSVYSGTSFEVAKSADGSNWSYVTTVDCSALCTTACWAPEWYSEGGNYYALFAVDSSKLAYIQATDTATFGTWGTPAYITGPSGANINQIDPFLYKEGSTYYLYGYGSATKVQTSTSMFSGYSAASILTLNGTNMGWEGPSLFRLTDGTYGIYGDEEVLGSGNLNRYATGSSPAGPFTLVGNVLFDGSNASYKHGTPLRVPASLLGNFGVPNKATISRFVSRTTAATSRTSTTTYADDSQLFINNIPPGRYQVEAVLKWNNGSIVPGAKAKFTFSGAKTSGGGILNLADEGGAVSVYPSPDRFGTDFEWSGASKISQNPSFVFRFVFVVTTNGNLTLQWAQQVSSADDCILQAKSWMILTALP